MLYWFLRWLLRSGAGTCAIYKSSSSSKVFVDTEANTRAFTFAPDAMGTQTEIKCHGSVPANCAGTRLSSVSDVQSCDFLSCDCEPDTTSIDFAYMEKMMNVVQPMCETATSENGFHVLVVGLGGGALPDSVLAKCPKGTKVESVEYDPRVIDAATNFFGLHLQPGVNEVENADGGEAIQRRMKQGRKYDVVMVDCFQAGDAVPDSCRNEAFVQGLHGVLKPGGKAIQQVWSGQLDSTLDTYHKAFGPDHVVGENVQLGVNFLILADA